MRVVLDSGIMSRLELQLLGTPEVRSDGAAVELGRKPLMLLVLLAFGPPAQPAQRWTRDALAPLLWPDTPNPLPNLSVGLGNLRESLGQVFGADEKKRTVWLETPICCDVMDVLEAARSERVAQWLPAWTVAQHDLLAFPEPQWDAKFAPEVQDWLTETRTALKDAKRNLATKLGVQALELGEYAQAVTYLEQVQPEESDPRELQATLLMLTLTALDQPEQAVPVFQRLQHVLLELDGKPSQDALVAFEIARDQQIAAARALLAEKFTQHAAVTDMPFVGRDTDLEQLERILPKSFEGIGWLTMITGEPGAGKTALARAAIQKLDARERIYLHCEGFGERNAPAWRGFDLICRNLVRRRRTVFDAMPTELRAVLARFLPDVLEPVTQDPQPGDERLLYAAIRTLLIHDDQPTLLFLDDLQWFDETSLGLVLELLRKPPPRGLLVIATFRDTEPPLTTNTQGIWARLLEVIHRDKRGQELALAALDLNAVEQLSSELQQPANTDWMHAQSGGNPLYLLEMFEANYTQPGRVPPDLEALIRSRIDTLPQRSIAREVLEACAVLGESTSLNEVKNVSGFDYDTTVQALGSLRDARLLQRAEARIQMNHNLTRDATLERMSLERGQVLNLRAARVRQERPELAAMHYWRAMGEGAEKLESEDMQLAVQAFTNTGTAQAFRGDLEGGLKWFERALEMGTDATSQVIALTRRARVFERLLKYEEAASDLRQATFLVSQVDPVTRASVLNAHGHLMAAGFGDAASCEQDARLALDSLAGLVHSTAVTERANTFNNLGVAAGLRHDLESAIRHHSEALELRTVLGDVSGMAKSHHNLGLALTSRGDAKARIHYEEALKLHEYFGNRLGIANVYGDVAWLEWRLGFFAAAEVMCNRALETGQPWGDDFNTHVIYNNLGAIRFFQGRYSAAREAYTAAMNSKYSASNKHIRATQYANLAEVELRLGLLENAKMSIGAALALLEESPNPGLEADVHWYKGELYSLLGEFEPAQEEYRQSVVFANSTKKLEREGESLARLARLNQDLTLIRRASNLADTPGIHATTLTLDGDFYGARILLQQEQDLYEETRLVADYAFITKDVTWLLEVHQLLGKLQDSTAISTTQKIRDAGG
jgi:tetratricopeptide (TPR) repeat protein